MKEKFVKKGNKYKKRHSLEVEDVLIALVIVLMLVVTISQLLLWGI